MLSAISVRVAADDGSVAYIETTGHNIRAPFLAFWYAHGGEDVIGPPLTEQFAEGGATVQYFRNARLDLLPDGGVRPAPLGAEASGGRTDGPFAPLGALPPDGATQRGFTESKHTLSNAFRRFWEARDGAALLGVPISEEFGMPGMTVQFFERGALAWRPDRATKADDVVMLPLGQSAFEARKYPAEWLGAAPTQATPPVALRVPVLMYHHIGAPSRYFTSLADFTAQMDWLKANGYETVTVAQLYEAEYGGRTLPPKPVVLTFDDGNGDQRLAFPVLAARGFVATYFIVSGVRNLSDDELVMLARTGNDIESHTVSHPFLTRTNDGALAGEMRRSRDDLEAHIGWPVRYLAYPYGDQNGRVQNAAAVVYRGAVIATGGANWDPNRRYTEPRMEIGGTLGLGGFIAAVTRG